MHFFWSKTCPSKMTIVDNASLAQTRGGSHCNKYQKRKDKCEIHVVPNRDENPDMFRLNFRHFIWGRNMNLIMRRCFRQSPRVSSIESLLPQPQSNALGEFIIIDVPQHQCQANTIYFIRFVIARIYNSAGYSLPAYIIMKVLL